jgi:predicted amidohydrolase YtcJ
MKPSFHNDGAVSAPSPLINIQTAVTRKTRSGVVRGAEEAISLDEALQACTINGAYALFKDHVLGSIEPGKWADFVVLSQDPYEVNPDEIGSIPIESTWLNGEKTNLDLFLQEAQACDPSKTLHLRGIKPACSC